MVTTKFRSRRFLVPVGILSLLLLSCGRYSATQLENSMDPPVVVPEVAAKTASRERLLKNAYRMTGSAEGLSLDAEEKAAGGDEKNDPRKIDNARELLSLEMVNKLSSYNTSEFAELVKQSFNRVHLDTANSFALMDAVALTAQYNREIKASYAQYQQSLGNLEMARGAFDLTTQMQWNTAPSYTYLGYGIAQKTDSSLYSLGFANLSRFGLQTNATFSYTGQQLSPSTGYSQLSQGNMALVFSLPLLQFGATSADAQEQARILALQASLAATVHQINTSLNTAIGNYWSYAAAVQNLVLSIDALERSRQSLASTTILVENHFQEPSTLHALSADFASKESARQNAEQQLVTARTQLAVTLGFPGSIAHHLPMPTSRFPIVEVVSACRIKANLPLLLKTALAKRQDYRQAELQLQSTKVLAEKYRRDVLPNVKLVAGITTFGFTEASAFSKELATVADGDSSVTAGIQVPLPWTNDTARGQLRNALGQTRGAHLAYMSAKETITADVNNNANGLFYAAGILRSQERAEKQYREATDDELKKFQLGLSSILDILDVADRLNGARSNTVLARARLATAISNLRYSTGTLFNDGEQGRKVVIEDLAAPLPPALLAELAEAGGCQ